MATTKTADNIKRATALRGYTVTMDKEIEKKRNCNVGLNLTHKRLEEQKYAGREADKLEKAKAILLRVADLYEENAVPSYLQLRYRAQAEHLVTMTRMDDYKREHDFLYNWSYMLPEKNSEWSKICTAIGIVDEASYIQARDWAIRLCSGQEDSELKKRVAILNREKELAISKIPDFFPTPQGVIDEMLFSANIEDGMSVLEPSAGSGSILDAIKTRYPKCALSAIEVNWNLAELLTLKGYDVKRESFLDVADGQYERIVMNPPFGNSADIEHVRYAYEFLKPGGRLVSVMSAGINFRTDRKTVEFKRWFECAGGRIFDNDPNAFKDSLVSTGTRTVTVVIDKPGVPDFTPIAEVVDPPIYLTAPIMEQKPLVMVDVIVKPIEWDEPATPLEALMEKMIEKVEEVNVLAARVEAVAAPVAPLSIWDTPLNRPMQATIHYEPTAGGDVVRIGAKGAPQTFFDLFS